MTTWKDLRELPERPGGPINQPPISSGVHVGDVLDPADVTTKEARHMVLGPDEILVVVFPSFVGHQALAEHRDRLREALGSRFVLVMGDGVQLAKVKRDDWARGTHDE